MSYDGIGRQLTLTSSDNSIHYRYHYNIFDEVVKITDCLADTSTYRDYDVSRQINHEELANGLEFKYQYDLLQRPTQVILPDGSGVEYSFNAAALYEVRRVSGDKVLYTYRESDHSLVGLPRTVDLPGNNGQIHYAYDAQDRCVSIESNSWNQRVPADGYDKSGNLRAFSAGTSSDSPSGAMDYSFEYNDLYQLKSERGHVEHKYETDSLANRLLKDDLVHELNSLNQLLLRGNEQFSYDLNGNLIQRSYTDGRVVAYEYDALDRLVKVVTSSTEICYTYDAFHRRLTRSELGQPTQNYLYQGQEEIGVYQDGKITQLKLHNRGSVLLR